MPLVISGTGACAAIVLMIIMWKSLAQHLKEGKERSKQKENLCRLEELSKKFYSTISTSWFEVLERMRYSSLITAQEAFARAIERRCRSGEMSRLSPEDRDELAEAFALVDDSMTQEEYRAKLDWAS